MPDLKARGRTDWARLRSVADDEADRIAATDPDNAENDDWARATIGAPPLRMPVNAMFDKDVVDWFKAQGRGYQARMNAVLRRYMEAQRKVG
jgi:uncharacterized protein (DUF4415 family)